MTSINIHHGRGTDDTPPDTVVFLIGMRINHPSKIRSWAPVFLQVMPRMLRELRNQPELGVLGTRTYYSGRVVMLVQYWRDAEHLNAYATARDHVHLPAWREFNRRIRGNADLGVFHETYIIDRHESIYVNMPERFGLGGATTLVPPGRRGHRAAHRLDPTIPDTPAVDPG